MAKRIQLRQWRCSRAEPKGLHVWFDPAVEFVRLYRLDPPKDEGVADACEVDDQVELSVRQSEENELNELPF